MSFPNQLELFALEATSDFGARVADCLGIERAKHEERDFEDGEHKARPLESVRGKDVFVLQSLHGDDRQTANDKLCRLLFFLGTLKESAALRVTAIVPYLCYARKDRQTKSRDPVTTKYLARLFEAVDVDRVVTMDVHNLAAFQNAFRIDTEHLEAKKLFVDHFAERAGHDDVVVVSPDAGGVKRAEAFRQALCERLDRPVSLAMMEKYRSEGVVSGEMFVGEVQDRQAIILDDLVSSGTTLVRAAKACRERGARSVRAAATHGIFVGDAGNKLADSSLDEIVVCNTVPPFRLSQTPAEEKLTVLDATPLVAEAIRRMHTNASLGELLGHAN